jgi:hypothetical protein
VVGVPRGKIPLTRFDIIELDGRQVLRVEASRSYGNLVHALAPAVPDAGMRLRWRWRLDQWTAHARDLAADFRLAFGHESVSLPALEAVLVGADADNTGSYSLGYVEGVTLSP